MKNNPYTPPLSDLVHNSELKYPNVASVAVILLTVFIGSNFALSFVANLMGITQSNMSHFILLNVAWIVLSGVLTGCIIAFWYKQHASRATRFWGVASASFVSLIIVYLYMVYFSSLADKFASQPVPWYFFAGAFVVFLVLSIMFYVTVFAGELLALSIQKRRA